MIGPLMCIKMNQRLKCEMVANSGVLGCYISLCYWTHGTARPNQNSMCQCVNSVSQLCMLD